MGEVITIHVGGAGCRLGAAFWRALTEDSGLGPDGQPTGSRAEEPSPVFFTHGNAGNATPRTLFAGTASAIDTIRRSELGRLFHPAFLLPYERPGVGARGREVFAAILEQASDRVRRLVDVTKSLDGFILTHAVGGRTASRLAPALMARLAADYPNTTIASLLLLPGADRLDQSLVTAPYSAVLCAAEVSGHAQLVIPADNAATHAACRSDLAVEVPSWDHLNRYVARAMCSFTEPLRRPGGLGLAALATGLAPAGRQRFVALEDAVAFAEDRAPSGTRAFDGLTRILGQFDRMRASGAYVHAFDRDGVDASALDHARARLDALIRA